MNIFKILASAPRERFAENQVSAFLGWLLNPYMDHGLGYEFLLKFLNRIEAGDEIINRLKPHINGQDENSEVKVFLEYKAGDFKAGEALGAIIDIVLVIDDDYCVSIENKIYSVAATNETQLTTQYELLQKNENHAGQKITMVFLVPKEDRALTDKEFDNLKVSEPDKKFKVTWTDIADDIQNILDEEQKCKISPLNEYLRHTIKAFASFIHSGFRGYTEPKQRKNYGINPSADKGYLSFAQILEDRDVTFVGIKGGQKGLEQIEASQLKTKPFQCTTSEHAPNGQWISRDDFLGIVTKRRAGTN